MTSQITRISYDGPFRQLSTAPANSSITVRDLCPTIQNMSSQNSKRIMKKRQDENYDSLNAKEVSLTRCLINN